jgi:hypothetical protein
MKTMNSKVPVQLATLFLLLSQTNSVAPPHRDLMDENSKFSKWESARQYRNRLSIDFNYSPMALSDEVCKYLNEKECEEYDVAFEKQVKRTRDIGRNEDRLKTLVILVQWQDHADKNLASLEDMNSLWNGVGTSDVIPSGSVKKYIEMNSYGKLHIQADVVDWIMTNGTESYYGNWRSG